MIDLPAAKPAEGAAVHSPKVSPLASREQRGPLYLMALGCAIAVLAFTYLSYRRGGALLGVYDDAYITFRYARNLATGRGLVFNVGERTDSASSLLHTLLLAGAYRVGFHDLERFATWLGLLCAAGVVWVVCVAAYNESRNAWCAFGLAAAAGINGLIAGWAINGMETPLFALLTVLAVWRLLILRRLGSIEVGLVALLVLVRIEGAVWLAIWLALAVRRWNQASARALAVQAAVLAGTALGFLLFKCVYYGTLLPHAYWLKRLTTLYQPNSLALWGYWSHTSLGLLLFALTRLVEPPRDLETFLLQLFVLGSCVSVALGPYSDWGRYSAHLLPIAALLSARPMAKLLQVLPVLAILSAGFIADQTLTSFDFMLQNTASLGHHQDCRKQVGRALEAHQLRGSPVLSSDIGAIAYAAPNTSFIDTVGLTSRAVLERRAEGRGIDDLLEARHVSVLADTCAGNCTRASQYSALNWMSTENFWFTALPETRYFDRFGTVTPLFRCVAPDSIGFGILDLESVRHEP